MRKVTTSDRLKFIMQQRELKQIDIIRLCEPYCRKYDEYIRRNDLSQYVSGKVLPGQRKLTILGLALDVSEVWLMGYDVPMEREERGALRKIEKSKQKQIPLLGSIACGAPILADGNVERMVSCPDDLDADFCLTCRGDSMIGARIYDGDTVYVRSQSDVRDGQIAVVMLPVSESEGEATLKRLYHNPDGSVTLTAENPRYPPLTLRDARIEGLAVAFLSQLTTKDE